MRRLDGIHHLAAAAMAARAVAALGEAQSSWRPAEVVRELAAAVPTTVTADSRQLIGFLETAAEQASADRCVDISRPVSAGVGLRRDGRPITESAVDRALTTRSILDEEEELLDWALRRRSWRTGRRVRPIRFTAALSTGQQEAVAAVTSHRGLELIVGPAGAGKTTMLTAARLNLRIQGRHSFGVAPTAAAAEVLATETGMAADTLDKLLTEHADPSRPPQPGYDLKTGTTVVVDEAGTASTPKLGELARLADKHRWRIVLVGDPRQFFAVGRGGMFAHLVDSYGAVELDWVHRFRHSWERQASLRLRRGDPTVLSEYDQRGRIHGGSQPQMEAEIITAWQQARDRGETVALMANKTATVAKLNRLAQQARIQAGELDAGSARLRVGDEMLSVGDEVVTRRNARCLRTDREMMVKNRDHWTISAIDQDHSVTAQGRTGTIRLPGDYVIEHLELGYAQTSHASQGRTVDTALLLLDSPADSRGVYTPMTRGRDANHAYVVVEDNQTGLDILTQAIARDWIDQPAIVRRAQLELRRRRRLQPPGQPKEDEVDELVRRARRIIAERQARRQELERALARGL